MELVIPLIALGSLYMSSKYSNTNQNSNIPQDTQNNNNNNNNIQSSVSTNNNNNNNNNEKGKEAFTNYGENRNYLPNVQPIPQNYPITNDQEVRDSSLYEYQNQTAATDQYFNQTVFENNSNNNIKTGNNIQQIFSLSGNVLKPDEFTHKNMVPFNSGKVAGRLYDDNIAETILDNMAGMGSFSIKKVEQPPLFSPSDNIQFAHGSPDSSDFIQSRQYVSDTCNNVKPFESIYVGPGIGDGYSSASKGGFNAGIENRELWVPKTVDQLRVETNPKMTFSLLGHEGPAQSVVKDVGQIGTVDKKLPDTFYINSPERWFTTTGVKKGEMERSIQDTGIIRRSNCDVNYMGPAGHSGESNTYSTQNYEPSNREMSKIQPVLGASKTAQGNPETHQNKQQNYISLNNNRSTNKQDNHIYRNMFGGPIGSVIAPIMNIFTSSRKEDLINNIRTYGDPGSKVSPGYIPCTETLKVTNKETTLYTPRAFVNNQREGTYLNNNVDLPINNRNQSNTSTMGFVGGQSTGYGETSYESAYNQTTNNIKSQTIDSRTNVGGMNLFNGNINVCSSKPDCSQQDFRMGPATSIIKVPASPSTYGIMVNPNKTSITEDNACYNENRMDPSLLKAFYENPYTHSLSSVA